MTPPRPRPARCRLATLLVSLLCSLALAGAAWAQPRVRVVATGGTIANDAGRRLSGTALVASVPGLAGIARVEAESFASTSSIDLTLSDWTRLSHRLRAVQASGVTGIVVTSGTDTLEELAWFLDLTLPHDVPVVVTGAMRRPSEPEPDGPRNLADAVRVAVDPKSRGRGTLVVMAGTILRAQHAAKLAVSGVDGFGPVGGGVAGRVSRGRVTFARQAPARREAPVFDLGPSTALPRVDVLLTYQQAPGDLIDAAVRAGARGLVVASAGGGSLSAAQADAIGGALRAGVAVVVASRVPRARLTADDVPAGAIAAGGLTPIKARVLLMVALARGDRPEAIARAFSAY